MGWGPINVAVMDLQLEAQALGTSKIGAVTDKRTNQNAL